MTSNVKFQFERGKAMFRNGKGFPLCPPESEFIGPCTDRAIVWLGYMLARAETLERARKLEDYIKGRRDRPE